MFLAIMPHILFNIAGDIFKPPHKLSAVPKIVEELVLVKADLLLPDNSISMQSFKYVATARCAFDCGRSEGEVALTLQMFL